MAKLKVVSRSSDEGISIGLPKKASLPVFIVTIVLAVLARTYQLLENMDFDTGRYIKNQFNIPVAVIILGMALMSMIMMWGVSKDKVIKSCILINPWRLRYDRLNKRISPKAGYACVMMCLLIFMQFMIEITTVIKINTDHRKTMDVNLAKDYSIFTGITVLEWLIYVFMFLTFVTFLTMGMNIFKQEGISRANCAALSLFAAWKVLFILNMFADNNMVAVTSEKVYILLSNMETTVFFIITARFFSGFEKKHTRFWMCFHGYLASILSAVSVLPRFILLFVPKGYDDRTNMALPDISDFGMIFVTVMIVVVFWSTYVYREMPKRVGAKRWTYASRPKDTSMKALDEEQLAQAEADLRENKI